MTTPQPAPATSAPTDERREILDEIVREMEQRAAEPDTLVGRTLRDAEQTVTLFKAIQDASLGLTYPEDWVEFKARDGARVCFLQDVGCQRIRPLWQIDFDAVRLQQDLRERELPDDHYVAEIIVRGRSSLTGETVEEIGFRSTAGFFEKDWKVYVKAEQYVEQARMKANVQKAAIANGRGRCVRTISGTAQVPYERLELHFGKDKVKRIRTTEFQAGTRGGAGNYASDAQVKYICDEAFRKVAGLDKAIDLDALKEKVQSANLTGGKKGRASQLIERLKAAEPKSLTVELLEQALGVQIVEKGGE